MISESTNKKIKYSDGRIRIPRAIRRGLRFSDAGFTLIEILTVIFILGILCLIGVPAFKTYQPSLQLSGTVRELVTDLRYAEGLAVTEQIDHGVRFFFEEGQYQIIRYGASEEIIKSKNLPQGVSFQEITGFTNNQAVFNPYGAAREAGIITFINTKNSTTTIDIRPSGFIKIIK